METIYKLNARELTSALITSIQNIYTNRDIEITIKEAETALDETEYLFQSPANRIHLEKAIDNIEQGKNLVSFENLEEAIQCVDDRAAR